MKRKTFVPLVVVALLGALTLGAAELKIAVINMDRIFQEYFKTREADANLKKQAEIYKDYAEKLNSSKLKLQEEFKSLRNASQNIALSESEKEKRRLAAREKYRQLLAKEAEFEEYNREKQTQLREEYERKRGVILEEIQKEVRRKSVLEGYALVVDISGKTLNNIPSVVYYNPALDITDEVLDRLNRGNINAEKAKD